MKIKVTTTVTATVTEEWVLDADDHATDEEVSAFLQGDRIGGNDIDVHSVEHIETRNEVDRTIDDIERLG